MVDHPKQPEQKRQIEITGICRVLAVTRLLKACIPASILDISLSSDKVPEEVSHIHVIQLITQKVVQIRVVVCILTQVVGLRGVAAREEFFIRWEERSV